MVKSHSPLSVNCYHRVFKPGDAVRLVQFYFEREHDVPLYLTTQEVIALSAINARYVYPLRVASVVVVIADEVIYNAYETGYTATGTQPSTRHLLIGHYQYPTYVHSRQGKYQWQLYALDLSAQGSYTCTVWEDQRWVKQHTDKIRYKRLRERLRALPED